MAKVSVIVPIYNVEKYLPKCLDSLVNQTLDDIEIILVNDGSLDNSGKIAKEYSENIKIKSFILKKKMVDYLMQEIMEYLMLQANILHF